jgi:hypothetical protein
MQKVDVLWNAKQCCVRNWLILCGVIKVVETRYEIFGLSLQTSALSSHPI